MAPAYIRRFTTLGLVLLVPLAVAAAHVETGLRASGPASVSPAAPDQVRVNPDARAISEFMDKVKQYVALHQKLEATLPRVPTDATPQQLDQSQRALGRLIQQARADAKPGDLFVKDSRAVLRRLLVGIFGGPGGKELKASIMDENVGPIRLHVNGRYPDNVPLSTVPAQVLQVLPKLPEELEYRFVGNRLILFDEHAHLVADFMDNALPS